MAATCTTDGLVSGAACLSRTLWSKKDQEAMMVLFLASLLVSGGGEDYGSALTTTLLTDSIDLAKGMSDEQRYASLLYIISQWSSYPIVPGDIASTIACLNDVPEDVLKSMQLLLWCKLSQLTIA